MTPSLFQYVAQSLFGLDLSSTTEREYSLVENVPNIVTVCIRTIRNRGLQEEGIFRVSPGASDKKQLRVDFTAGNGASIVVLVHKQVDF